MVHCCYQLQPLCKPEKGATLHFRLCQCKVGELIYYQFAFQGITKQLVRENKAASLDQY